MRDDLERVFDFDESDLLLNQKGQLSENQLKTISVYRRMIRVFGRLAFVVMFLSLGSISLIALYNIGIDLEKNPAEVVVYVVFFSVGMLLFIFSILLGKIRSDLKSGRISMVEGFADKKEKKMPRRLGTAYFVTIGKVKFQLDGKAKYRAIQPNVRYRIFYVKHPPTHIILSIST